MKERLWRDLTVEVSKKRESFVHLQQQGTIYRFLLAKLKASGIDGAVLNWIKSYLSNRSYQVQTTASFLRRLPVIVASPRFSYWPITFSSTKERCLFCVVKYWKRLPTLLVLAPSVSIFKKQLDRHWFEIFPAAPV